MGIKEVIDFAYSHTDEDFVIVDCQILEEVAKNLKKGTKPQYPFDEIESVADDIVETLPLDDEMRETLYKFIDEVETKLFKGEEIKESASVGAMFYVMDLDEGVQVGDEMCGQINEFESYSKCAKVAKQVSLNFEGRFTVGVMVSSDYWEGGKKFID